MDKGDEEKNEKHRTEPFHGYLFLALPHLHDPQGFIFAIQRTDEIHPSSKPLTDPVALVDPHPASGDVVEGEAVGGVAGDGGEGGEGVGADRKA